MKKVLLLTTVCPIPLSDGKKVVLNGLMSYLIEKFGASEITWTLVSNETKGYAELTEFGIRCERIAPPSLLRKISSVFWKSFITRSLSIQEALFASSGLRQQVSELINKNEPDIIICDTIRMGQLMVGCKTDALKVVYLDDLFSVRYSRMLEQIQAGVTLGDSVLGNFGSFIPVVARKSVNRCKFLQKILLTFERRQVERSEIKVASAFDVAALVNPDEAALLALRTGKSIAELRPWLQVTGVKCRAFSGRPTFVFMGSLNIPHNEVALLEFLKLSFGDVVKRIPGARLCVIGSKPSARIVESCAEWGDQVALAGFVPDVNQIMATCCGMIVPLLFGSGVKLKVLDALARGVPIVSTTVGIEGVPVSHGQECYVENDIAKFGHWLERLVEPAHNAKMSGAGSRLFNTYYSRKAVFENYSSLLQDRRVIRVPHRFIDAEVGLEAASQ